MRRVPVGRVTVFADEQDNISGQAQACWRQAGLCIGLCLDDNNVWMSMQLIISHLFFLQLRFFLDLLENFYAHTQAIIVVSVEN